MNGKLFSGNAMKRLAYWLLLLAIYPGTSLADWTRSGATSDGEFTHYVDLSSIRRNGNLVRMWALFEYRETTSSRRYLSSSRLSEHDCVHEQSRLISYTTYSGRMGNGAVDLTDRGSGSWSPDGPGTVGRTLWEIACGRRTVGSQAQKPPVSNADFDLVNQSSQSILFVHVTPTGSSDVGDDRLGDDTLVSGSRKKIMLPRDGICRYDVFVGYGGGRWEVRSDQNLCGLTEIAFNGSTIITVPSNNAPSGRTPPDSSTAGGQSFGTGFFISAQGHALTNNHVIRSCRSIVAVVNGSQLNADVIRRDERNDLALIHVKTTRQVPFARFRSGAPIKAGDGVMVAGFPLPNVLQNGLNVTLGNVSALAGLGGNAAFLQVTAPVQPGNSGGPLLDMAGNIVGVVVSKLDAMRVAQSTGDIPQNINFAVQGPMARLFLEAGGQRFDDRPFAKELRVADVSDLARSFTFQIECR